MIKIPHIEEARKGRGLFLPYGDWEADSPSADYAKAKEFSITGRNSLKGWKFAYSDGRLESIETPEEDAAAMIAADAYIQEDYSLLGHNCYDLGPDAIFDAINSLRQDGKEIDVDDGPSPNSAFTENLKKGAVIWSLPE